ncbi:hypothetical protein PENSPDRAFT_160775 [Peniophora sp. CONT]|nr:hypothetical protein PENSPDRAFT_160775 [Peniophora sp. CONT]
MAKGRNATVPPSAPVPAQTESKKKSSKKKKRAGATAAVATTPASEPAPAPSPLPDSDMEEERVMDFSSDDEEEELVQEDDEEEEVLYDDSDLDLPELESDPARAELLRAAAAAFGALDGQPAGKPGSDAAYWASLPPHVNAFVEGAYGRSGLSNGNLKESVMGARNGSAQAQLPLAPVELQNDLLGASAAWERVSRGETESGGRVSGAEVVAATAMHDLPPVPPSSRAQGKLPMKNSPAPAANNTANPAQTNNNQQANSNQRSARAQSKAPLPPHAYPAKQRSAAGVAASNAHQAAQAANGTGQNAKIWSTSSSEERERIKEFWLGLGESERRGLVRVEKEAVLKKMKEQQKHSCACAVCGRKRSAIEEELEVLYDAYYDELEQYANYQQRYHASGGTLPAPATSPASTGKNQTRGPARSRVRQCAGRGGWRRGGRVRG